MTRVKICGITNLEDAINAVELGVDALGFVFAPSPREISPEKAKEIIEKLPPWVSVVGVFVDEKPSRIMQIVSQCKLDYAQLHGEEMPEYCEQLDINSVRSNPDVTSGCRRPSKAGRRTSNGVKIIKTIKNDIKRIPEYKVSGILLDISKGTGKVYNWDLAIEAKKYGKPIILSGGLTPANVKQAIKKVKPYGVDVSTGVELSPGKKHYEKMKEFMEGVKHAA